jgi:saccharopine dehydrogenase-like NADP-dependent oxidoreductase
MTIKVLVLGSGHIGRAIAHLLSRAAGQPAYRVTLADRHVPPALREQFDCAELDADADGFADLLRGYDLVVNALPFIWHRGWRRRPRSRACTTST